MNSGPTGERVYEALKRRVLSLEFRPGDHLDPGQLAATLTSSATPVREALYMLMGEGLIEARTGSGFHLPLIDAPALEDLYEWNGAVAAMAVASWPAHRDDLVANLSESADPACVIADLFARIAGCSANAEHGRAIGALNDRLAPFRLCETTLLAPSQDEHAELEQLLSADRRSELKRTLAFYHRKRRRIAAELVRARYRQSLA